MDERHEIQVEIDTLKNRLTADSSDIGDWKIAKIMEYRAMGEDDPYDIEELGRKRQAVRDRINELQDRLDALPSTPVEE